MSNKDKFDKADYRRIVARYKAGKSAYAIGKSYGVATETISRILERQGIEVRQIRANLFSTERELEIVNLYDEGASHKELGRRFKCHASTIRNILGRHGKIARQRGGIFRFFTPQEEMEMIGLYDNGESQDKIAARFGCSQPLVSRILRASGRSTKSVSANYIR